MGVWGYILLFALVIGGFILLMSVFSNYIIMMAARRYSKTTLEKHLASFETLLPGKNCGKCGYATCAEYAQAVFALVKDADLCPEGDSELPKRLNAEMEKFLKLMEDDTPKKKDDKDWR